MKVLSNGWADDASTGNQSNGRLVIWCTCAAIALIGALSVFHRIGLALRNSGDFSTVYTATRVWAAGGNPYDETQLVKAWSAADAARPPTEITQLTPSVYPPGTFVLISPFAAFSRWSTARDAWLCVNLLSVAALVWALVDLSGLPWNSPRGLLVAAAPLWLSAVHDGVSIGNPALAATTALLLTVCISRRGGQWAAGLLLTVAIALKPQIGGPFLGYFLLRRQWRISTVAAVGAVAVTILAIARLRWGGVDWVGSLAANVRDSTSAGACNDPTWHNPFRFQLINLQLLFQTAFESQRVPGLLAFAVSVGLAFPFALTVWRGSSSVGGLAGQSPISVLAELAFVSAWLLLPIYHRWLDAAPLATAITWAIVAFPARRWRWIAAAIVAAVAPAFALVPVIRSRLFDPSPGFHPASIHGGLAIVYPSASYCVLAAIMLWVVCRNSESRLAT